MTADRDALAELLYATLAVDHDDSTLVVGYTADGCPTWGRALGECKRVADAILAAGWRPAGDLRARVAEELRKADEDFDANSASSFRQVLHMIDGTCSICEHPVHSGRCGCGCRHSTTR